MVFLCVDIGGTNTILGVGESEFRVTEKIKTEDFLKDAETSVEKVLASAGASRNQVESTAVAAAGPVDRAKKVFYPPNLSGTSGMDEVDLGDILGFADSIKIVNDCTAAALGEYHYGSHGSDNLVYVTISSGIGAGVIIEGQVAEGMYGNFGEVGHMKVGEELECGCGGKGHWEAYCSGENMPQMAEQLFDASFDSSRQIFDEYRERNPKAEMAIAKMHEVNGYGLGNLVNLYNPEKIVLGGALPLNHPEIMVDPLEKQVEENSVSGTPEIGLCDLEERSVIHGLRAVCNGKFTSKNSQTNRKKSKTEQKTSF